MWFVCISVLMGIGTVSVQERDQGVHASLSADLCPNSKLLVCPKQCAEIFNKASNQVNTRRKNLFCPGFVFNRCMCKTLQKATPATE